MARGNMLARTPGGDGLLIRAHELAAMPAVIGRRVRLNPGGGEYEAVIEKVEPQPLLTGWVRITHRRDGFGRSTVNVVPPSVEVRILK